MKRDPSLYPKRRGAVPRLRGLRARPPGESIEDSLARSHRWETFCDLMDEGSSSNLTQDQNEGFQMWRPIIGNRIETALAIMSLRIPKRLLGHWLEFTGFGFVQSDAICCCRMWPDWGITIDASNEGLNRLSLATYIPRKHLIRYLQQGIDEGLLWVEPDGRLTGPDPQYLRPGDARVSLRASTLFQGVDPVAHLDPLWQGGPALGSSSKEARDWRLKWADDEAISPMGRICRASC